MKRRSMAATRQQPPKKRGSMASTREQPPKERRSMASTSGLWDYVSTVLVVLIGLLGDFLWDQYARGLRAGRLDWNIGYRAFSSFSLSSFPYLLRYQRFARALLGNTKYSIPPRRCAYRGVAVAGCTCDPPVSLLFRFEPGLYGDYLFLSIVFLQPI